MEARATPDERRIARLEEELASCKAQAETAAVNYDQASRAMEARFEALSEEHERAIAAKQQLQLEHQRQGEELSRARNEINTLRAQMVKKDALLEERAVQIDSLRMEKRSLDKQLEHRQQDISELESRLKTTQANLVSLTEQNTKLDAEVQEGKAAARRKDLEVLQLQQVNENLERNNKWLEENLSHLGEALKAERQKNGAHVLELESKLQESELRIASLTTTEVHLQARVAQKEKAAEDAQNTLKTEQKEAAIRDQQFEKELATAQKLAALYKSNGDQRATECAELSNIVRELRQHVEDITAAHLAATQKLEEAASSAEKRFENEKQKCQRMLEAAASGQFPAPAQRPPVDVSPASGDGLASPATVTQMSKTEIYAKYAEATSNWKEERLRNRQNEILLDTLCTEMERKAVLVQEQQAEYERVQTAYRQTVAALEALKHEKRHAEAVQLDLEAEIRREAKKRSLLEQQVKDLGQQVTVLLNEQQRKAAPRSPGEGWALVATNGSSAANAGDVISDSLVVFSDIQGLQEQNQKQLAVIRELTQQLEDNAAQLKSELNTEKTLIKQKAEAELKDFRAQRAEQEELVQQIARQRDMFRKLLQDAANNPARAAAAAADLQLIAAADAQSKGQASQAREEPDYKQLRDDLEKELTRVKAESAEHSRMLRDVATKAKEDAAAARAEAARVNADADFQRRRADRQAEHLEEQQRQMQAISAHSAQYQSKLIEFQQRLSTALADQQSEQQRASVLENQVHRLQTEKRLSAVAEQRLAAEVSKLSSGIYTREAELKMERENSAKLEAQYAAERGRLNAELAKARLAETDAAREALEAQKRARDATSAKEMIQEQVDERTTKLEAEVTKARAAESAALQKAATAQGKAEVLQKALQKAEERAANLEFQANSRSQHPGEGPSAGTSSDAGDRESQLSGQLRLLQEELNAAYEKAAQATSHVSQYQALAESSDQALKAMQKDHEAYKAEADKHISAAAAEATNLKERLDSAESARNELRKQLAEVEQQMQQAKEEAANTEKALKAEIERKEGFILSKQKAISSLERDGSFWREKFNSAEDRAQREVMSHAETIKQLLTADKAKTILDNTIKDHIRARENAEANMAIAEANTSSKVEELTAAVEAAEKRREQVEQQNTVLHERLEKMASQLPNEGEEDIFGVISYLRHQTRVLEEEKQLQQHEAGRLRSEISVLKRTLDSVRAELASESSRQDTSKRDEALFEERKQHQADLNMVKESNASLRSQNSELDRQLLVQKAKNQDLERARRPRELKITHLEADVENLKEEVKLRADEALRWEKRVAQLQEKYDKVDLAEYRRVEAELKALQAATNDMIPRSELAKAEARVREVEGIARGKVASDYHRRTVESFQKQLAESQAAANELKGRLGEAEELRSQIAALEAAKAKAESSLLAQQRWAKKHMGLCNPSGLKAEEWRAKREQENTALDQLDKALKAYLAPNSSAGDLNAKLAADKARITELESQMQTQSQSDTRVKALQHSLAASETRAAELEASLARANAQAADAAQKLAQAEKRVAELQAQVVELQGAQGIATDALPADNQIPAPQATNAEVPQEATPLATSTAMQVDEGALDQSAAQIDTLESQQPVQDQDFGATSGAVLSLPTVAEAMQSEPILQTLPQTQTIQAASTGPPSSEGIPALSAAPVSNAALPIPVEETAQVPPLAIAPVVEAATTTVPAAVTEEQTVIPVAASVVPVLPESLPAPSDAVSTPAAAAFAPAVSIAPGMPTQLNPSAPPFQAAAGDIGTMASLRERALQMQRGSVVEQVKETDSTAKRPAPAEAQISSAKRFRIGEDMPSVTPAAAPPSNPASEATEELLKELETALDVPPAATELEPMAEEEDADEAARWAMGETEQQETEGSEEEMEEEEEEEEEDEGGEDATLQSQEPVPASTPLSTPAKQPASVVEPQAKAAAPSTEVPAAGEVPPSESVPSAPEGEGASGGNQQDTAEEKPVSEGTRSSKRRQRPTPISWTGGNTGKPKKEGSGPETSPQAAGGRGERAPTAAGRLGLLGRGRITKGRRGGRRGGSSAE